MQVLRVASQKQHNAQLRVCRLRCLPGQAVPKAAAPLVQALQSSRMVEYCENMNTEQLS